MRWSIGYDNSWKRWIGYGVPAYCDLPGCGKDIDRGLAFVCGGEPYGQPHGCGLYFCPEHLTTTSRRPQRCPRCVAGKKPYKPGPEHPDWINHILTDESWTEWRAENTEETEKFRALSASVAKSTASIVNRKS